MGKSDVREVYTVIISISSIVYWSKSRQKADSAQKILKSKVCSIIKGERLLLACPTYLENIHIT